MILVFVTGQIYAHQSILIMILLCFCYFKPAFLFHLISEELKNAQSYTKDFKQQILDLRGTLSPLSHYYVVARVLRGKTFFLANLI